MTIVCQRIETQRDLVKALRLRIEVFILEQHVPVEEELDAYDEDAIHAIVVEDGTCVGTGRLAQIDGTWKIGRMAVRESHRGRGVGRRLVRFLEAAAREAGIEAIHLAAQVSAIGFYERLGYTTYGERFLDAGIDHRMMKKDFGANDG